MFSGQPDLDYQIFQDRHRDFEKEAERERHFGLCQPKYKTVSVQRRLITCLGRVIQFVCGVFSKRYPETVLPEETQPTVSPLLAQ